ncbi:secreted RxLR effector protein 161-like [Leptopilina heterotoma]|uniref:secreted RxLR effector protein 161-like n=1 Tax=Leptopilina heterotoma TaxID=63436 RepID=UPI001CA94BC6|nr:secreted RxLR effector protein 161-like [Leptopilina heterotoma]
MSDCKPVSTPLDPGVKLEKAKDPDHEENSLPYRELLRSLMYLAMCTRPDIAYATSYLSQFNNCYNINHWTAVKRVLRYLQRTKNVGLHFYRSGKSLEGCVDADWANCSNDRKSYTGFSFILGGSSVSWESRKQRTVALSSTEAEYMALAEAGKEAAYLKRFLKELGLSKTLYNVNNNYY